MKKLFNTRLNTNAGNIWLLVSRLTIGGLMLTHGYPKLLKLLEGNVQFADPFGIGASASLALAVFGEVVCSVLLIFGLATRFASIALIINMLVAILIAHAGQPFGKKELAILYLVFFIGFAILGGGKFSIDRLITGKTRSRY